MIGVGGGSVESKKELLLMILQETEGMQALKEAFVENQHLRVSYSSLEKDGKVKGDHHARTSRFGLGRKSKSERSTLSSPSFFGLGGVEAATKPAVKLKHDDAWIRQSLEALEVAKAEAGESLKDQVDPKERLKALLQRPPNKICADCSAHKPTWGSTNLGVFICTQCAGVHRSLGVHISAMLSTKLDDWTQEQLDVMDAIGNTRANERYEFHVPDEFPKPHHQEDRYYREIYIREKYEQQAFIQKTRKPPKQNDTPFPPPPPDVKFAKKKQMSMTAGMVEFIGYINVTLVKGENLLRMGYKGSDENTNPFCVLQLGNQKVQSKVCNNSSSPEWGETMMLCWDGIEELHLDIFSSDEHMGGHTVPLLYLLDEEADRNDSMSSARKEDSVISNCPDLGSITEEGEEGARSDSTTSDKLLGSKDLKKTEDGSMWLPLEHRDTSKLGKKTMGVKTKTKRVARGSVFSPRAATGGIVVKITFERLSH
mmetsp:Transcript_15334/g.28644  ORF Transcript_15334/g.28644 Transcript_15334/m.28644 type:complete len:483 (+) Transcript_15334:195-1643(+)|eukprot:CAMPEP_0182505320 /NCGR_PEP_ID=MMETSP1321-20130603/19016_1 /TAXON_ID=91990 /ORGANISM="Bolidomonas sp., Strain RCC1657" /LENGTH=482 /DNA_ID=CAMNT_0024710845 /DNA_START=178 /DNA_END=1626 /DNA_ORIENTATION=+